MLKFVSYDGKWPALCCGTLVVEKDGMQHMLKHILHSGGHCYFNHDYSEARVEEGPWKIDEESLLEELRDDYDELLDLVNDNISYGCCGGCL